jgi:class 3 adenylate cyclase
VHFLAIQQPQRHLAAILAADVAGYSRLMSANEEGTLARLQEHRRELGDPKIKEHRGHIIKTTGDGMLVEFASAVRPDKRRQRVPSVCPTWDSFSLR